MCKVSTNPSPLACQLKQQPPLLHTVLIPPPFTLGGPPQHVPRPLNIRKNQAWVAWFAAGCSNLPPCCLILASQLPNHTFPHHRRSTPTLSPCHPLDVHKTEPGWLSLWQCPPTHHLPVHHSIPAFQLPNHTFPHFGTSPPMYFTYPP
jgi:hypothetical protein